MIESKWIKEIDLKTCSVSKMVLAIDESMDIDAKNLIGNICQEECLQMYIS